MSLWLRLHRHAMGDALRRIGAQPVSAALSALVLAVAISLPIVAAVALRAVGALTAGMDTDPHVNVYLSLDAADADARRIEAALRADSRTAAVRFVPRDEALRELRSSTHLAELLANLEGNPLPHAFTVRVRGDDPKALDAARDTWAKLPGVDQVVGDWEWSRRLRGWIGFGDRILATTALALAAAVAFIVGHLIRVQVVSARQEIEVSRLLGATRPDVRRPFLYHGLLQGFVAGAAALAIAWAVTVWLRYQLEVLTPAYASEFKVVFFPVTWCLAVLAATALLGMLGAGWAVGRELRQISPSP